MADETTRIDDWLHDALTGDSGLVAVVGDRVYSEVAPAGAVYPFVVFSQQNVDDVVGATEATRIMVDGLWSVLGVDETGTWQGDLKTISDRIDVVLQASAGGTVDGHTVFASHRVRPLRFVETRDGRQFRRLGGTYRILAQ